MLGSPNTDLYYTYWLAAMHCILSYSFFLDLLEIISVKKKRHLMQIFAICLCFFLKEKIQRYQADKKSSKVERKLYKNVIKQNVEPPGACARVPRLAPSSFTAVATAIAA